MEGDPKFEGSQDLPDFPYASYAELLGLKGIRVDSPEQVGPAWDRGAARRPPGRLRGDHRSGGPAAAAAHHDRAGQGAQLGAAGRRPGRRADRQAVVPAEDAGVPARAMSSGRPAIPAAGGRGRPDALEVAAYTDSHRCARGRRDAGLGLDDDRRRARARRRRRPGSATPTPTSRRRSWSSPSWPGSSTVATRSSPQAAWAAMVGQTRNLGRPGITSMAIAAVDSRSGTSRRGCSGCRSASCSGWRTSACPSTARAASPRTRIDAARRAAGRLGRAGHSPGQDEGRLRAVTAILSGSVARTAIGPNAELFVDANGAYSRKQALDLAGRFRGRRAGQLVRGAGVLRGPRGAAPAARPRAGRNGDRGRRIRLRRALLRADARAPAPWTCCRPTSPGAPGSPSFSGSVRCAARTAVPLSLHCGPAIHLHPATALEQLVHLEYFHDHVRIEHMLFDGVVEPRDGALCPTWSAGQRARAQASGGRALCALSGRLPLGARPPPSGRQPVVAQRPPRADAADAGRCHRVQRAAARIEIYFEHFRGSFGDKWMWTPVALSPALTLAGMAGVRSERAAKTWLPALSALYCLDGVIGVVTHVRGVARKPGGFERAAVQHRDGAAAARARARWRWSGGMGLAAAAARPRAADGTARDFRERRATFRTSARIGRPASPEELPRQRNGITPQMHGRYPDYNVLDQADHWDEVTRRRRARARRAGAADPLLHRPEAGPLGVFCDLVMAQDREPRDPGAEHGRRQAVRRRARRLSLRRHAR